MDLKIPYIQVKDAKSAFDVAQKFLQSDGLSNVPFKPAFTFDNQQQKISAKGSGFEIVAVFLQSHVEIKVELSLLYRAFKGKLLSILEQHFKKHL